MGNAFRYRWRKRETYMHDGRSGDIDLMLWPVNLTLAYVGYEVLASFSLWH
jgi:NAD(P)H dehydrogenase (quinone)